MSSMCLCVLFAQFGLSQHVSPLRASERCRQQGDPVGVSASVHLGVFLCHWVPALLCLKGCLCRSDAFKRPLMSQAGRKYQLLCLHFITQLTSIFRRMAF